MPPRCPAWSDAARLQSGIGPWRLLAGMVLLALLWRAPGLLQTDLNLDESLYRLIGGDLAAGTAPYVGLWDRKPVGSFLIIAGIDRAFGPGLLAFRAAGAACVGLSGWLLALAGRRLFPDLPLLGPLAGVLYVLFSIGNGGAGTNTEHYLTPLGLIGFCLLLAGAARRDGPAGWQALLAGLAFGAAIQVKQYAAFDALAYGAIALLAMLPVPRAGWRRLAGSLALVALGAALPTLGVLGWFAAIGRLGLWYDANVTANLGLATGAGAGLNLSGLWVGLRGFDLLVLGSLGGLGMALALPAGRAAWRGVLGLVVWFFCMALFLLASRRFADHFFLQVLPALAMATALGPALLLARASRGGGSWRRCAGLMLAGLLLVLAARAGGSALHGAAEMLVRRHTLGAPHWGDHSASLAERLRGRIAGPADILMFGRWLGVHGLTGTRPGGRFPFVEHLWAGYAPVDGVAELTRLLAAEPRFIVLESRWLDRAAEADARTLAVFETLWRSLAKDYEMEGRVGPFVSWRGGRVGGEIEAVIFRRRGVAPPG